MLDGSTKVAYKRCTVNPKPETQKKKKNRPAAQELIVVKPVTNEGEAVQRFSNPPHPTYHIG